MTGECIPVNNGVPSDMWKQEHALIPGDVIHVPEANWEERFIGFARQIWIVRAIDDRIDLFVKPVPAFIPGFDLDIPWPEGEIRNAGRDEGGIKGFRLIDPDELNSDRPVERGLCFEEVPPFSVGIGQPDPKIRSLRHARRSGNRPLDATPVENPAFVNAARESYGTNRRKFGAGIQNNLGESQPGRLGGGSGRGAGATRTDDGKRAAAKAADAAGNYRFDC